VSGKPEARQGRGILRVRGFRRGVWSNDLALSVSAEEARRTLQGGEKETPSSPPDGQKDA